MNRRIVLCLQLFLLSIISCSMQDADTGSGGGVATVVGGDYRQQTVMVSQSTQTRDTEHLLNLQAELYKIHAELTQQLQGQTTEHQRQLKVLEKQLKAQIAALKHQQAPPSLGAMLSFVQSFCGEFERSGEHDQVKLQGRFSAAFSGLIKKLANLGLTLEAENVKSTFNNVQQQDLVADIINNRACRLSLWHSLDTSLRSNL